MGFAGFRQKGAHRRAHLDRISDLESPEAPLMATSPMPLPPEMTPEQLFLAQLDHIRKVAAHACRRCGFSREETQDFVARAEDKVMDDDYSVIRKHKGTSTLRTYLTLVIRNLFKDHLDQLWGKWRPSAEAERLGPLAVQLEVLYRDGHNFDEACKILLTNHHVEASREELKAIDARLPLRNPPRKMESDVALEDRPAETLTPAQAAEARERASRKSQVLTLLKTALKKLPSDDAQLAQMSCAFKVSQIARRLKLDQKPLYRRLDKIFETLRKELESQGVDPNEVGGLLGAPEDEDDELQH
jgi:RNA polymerase sigma factor (sigma-70 family)